MNRIARTFFSLVSLTVFSFSLYGAGNGLPYEFKYGGKVYKGYEGTIDGTLKVSVVRAEHPEFDQSEYTVWFENVGDRPSKVLEDVYALKTTFKGSSPVLRGCLGDHVNYYTQYSRDLLKEDVTFTSTEGRATHIVFPYFDLVHGNSGTRIALGWAGTWEAKFSAKGKVTTVTAQTNLGLKGVLLPGEKIRTGLVVMMDYESRDENVSVNKWRAWFMKHNLPKADAQGNELQPFCTTCFASDTGLPNTDGSISETYYTWQRTLSYLVREDFIPDFRWFDAGWYSDPAGNSVPFDGNWWATTGSWELDPVKWPDNTFRESNEACHALGMKVLVWFEPERVTDVPNLCRNYGYKSEWGIETPHCITSNIGDPECLAWTLGRITRMMEMNDVDLYREDNNSDPAAAWKILDSRDEEKYGLPRQGINENKCIQGHYALWDGILDFCRRHGKCTFLDSCASGGGRNDIESLRRSIPFMRSDYDRTTIPMRLQQSAGFNKWVPFHGSSTKETVGQLDRSSVAPDLYITRASLLPVWNAGAAFTHNTKLDMDVYRRNRSIWKANSHLLVKDFFELTPWHGCDDTSLWTVFAYNDPQTCEGILLGFRGETCEAGTCTVKLPFVRTDADYTISDDDTDVVRTVSGKELSDGIELHLDSPRSSLLWHIRIVEK